MTSHNTRLRGALALTGAAALLALAACGEDSVEITNPPALRNELFRTYVAMGNSITAGYQSGGLNDSLQQRAYPALLAQQMGTTYEVQRLRMPGCPAPFVAFGTTTRVTVPGFPVQPCYLLLPQGHLDVVNNVAVPGALIADATSNTTASGNILTELLAGGKSQVTRMLDASPTFVSVWLGNNDVLGGATTGVLTPTANIGGTGVASPGITATATFQTRFQTMVDSIRLAPRLQGGVLIGVVDVVNAPYFFPGAALNNPQVKGAIDQAAGRPVTVLNCGPTTTALIGIQIINALRANPALVISCAKIPGQAVAGDLFIVDETERATLSAAVAAYNAFIQQKANELGFAYYDPNPTLVAERTAGRVSTFPNLAAVAPASPFGVDFSYDGVHPSSRAHRLIANEIIAVINAKYGTSLATVTVD